MIKLFSLSLVILTMSVVLITGCKHKSVTPPPPNKWKSSSFVGTLKDVDVYKFTSESDGKTSTCFLASKKGYAATIACH